MTCRTYLAPLLKSYPTTTVFGSDFYYHVLVSDKNYASRHMATMLLQDSTNHSAAMSTYSGVPQKHNIKEVHSSKQLGNEFHYWSSIRKQEIDSMIDFCKCRVIKLDDTFNWKKFRSLIVSNSSTFEMQINIASSIHLCCCRCITDTAVPRCFALAWLLVPEKLNLYLCWAIP